MKTRLLIALLAMTTIANAQYDTLLNFDMNNGWAPNGSLISDGTYLYGVTYFGGINLNGVIFKIKPNGTGYSKLHDFATPTGGIYPTGSLISLGGFLYGMTNAGGANDSGVVFKIQPNGSSYAKLLDFSGAANGSSPIGSLFSDGTFLYGMTTGGGANGKGTIFKIKPDGTSYTKLLDFAGALNGSSPNGSLISDGTFLYGMASGGGTNNDGVIFKIKPDGTGYNTLLNFSGVADGKSPMGSLISDGTFLYGMTKEGGTFTCPGGCGVMFKIKPDGTGYSKMVDFDATSNGYYPYGDLLLDGGFLYGMTTDGGSGNVGGAIVKIKPDGTGYAVVQDLSVIYEGWYPHGSLISVGTILYGMSQGGGDYNSGNIFKLNPAGMGIAENNQEKTFTIYPNPFSTQTTLHTTDSFKNASLTICNSVGQTVKRIDNLSGQTIILHRDNLPSGLYFFRITQDSKTISADKFVIVDK